MIATLEGTVAHKDTDHLVILVGGVGIEVFAPYTTIEKINSDRAFLYTRLIVREDSLTLYGFATESERGLFDVFVKISGIGPKLAITMLGSLSVDNIHSAVLSQRPEILTRVPRHSAKKQPKKSYLNCKTNSRPVWTHCRPTISAASVRMLWMP